MGLQVGHEPKLRGVSGVPPAKEQLRLGKQDGRLSAPSATRRLLGGGEASVNGHLLRSGGTRDGSQHDPSRVERRCAVHRHPVERSGVEEGRPPSASPVAAAESRVPTGARKFDCSIGARRSCLCSPRERLTCCGRRLG